MSHQEYPEAPPDGSRPEARDAMAGSASFASLGLIKPLLKSLADLGHRTPTPIQLRAIPPALSGQDVMGCARTGTGKTAAFLLPILQRLEQDPTRGPRVIRALVLSPTRELAAQIKQSVGEYGSSCAARAAVIFGGVGQSAQVRDLQRGIDVLVATPGRLEDLLAQRLVDLSRVEVLVLDEVDRMLDEGFLPAVRRIAQKVPRARQTLLFSATLPAEVRRLGLEFQLRPVEVSATVIASTPDEVEQAVYHIAYADKRELLEQLLTAGDLTRALVFTRTKHRADRVARYLRGLGAAALHGGKSQSSRERTLAAFKQGALKVLVATDLAARGLHVDGISHVINFDLPTDPDSYVHRIGRTARAGASGKAVSLCSPEERETLVRIERLIRRRLQVLAAPRAHPVPSAPRPPAVGSGGALAQPEPLRAGAQPRQHSGRRVFTGSASRRRHTRFS